MTRVTLDGAAVRLMVTEVMLNGITLWLRMSRVLFNEAVVILIGIAVMFDGIAVRLSRNRVIFDEAAVSLMAAGIIVRMTAVSETPAYSPTAASLGTAGAVRRSPTCWRHMA